MSNYVQPSKEVLARGYGPIPPANGVIKLHIATLLGSGYVISDSRDNFPNGKYLDLTGAESHQEGKWISTSSTLHSLLDEISQMKPGEKSRFTYKHDEIVGVVSLPLPEEEDLVVEVDIIEWSGEDISEKEDQSLIKMILKEGTSSSHPFWTGKCKVSIRKPEDKDDTVVTLRMGDSETYGVDVHVERCILTMTKNEVARLVTPDCDYEVTLLGLEKEKNPTKMDHATRTEVVQQSKDSGNDAYRAQKYRLARWYYERCITFCEASIDRDEHLELLRQQAHLNLAQVQIKQENYLDARDNCRTVLWQDPNNVKALYRRALANKNLNNLHVAESDLKHLLSLEPGNIAAKQLKLEVAKEWHGVVAEEKRCYQRAFEKIEQEHAKEEENAIPTKSLWEVADETCPPELQSLEAYDEYTKQLAEEAKLIAEEEQRRLDEYNAANPPKKKKKRKKKKKKQITITETEEVKVNNEENNANEEGENKNDVDDFKYTVSNEKTIIGTYDKENSAPLTAADSSQNTDIVSGGSKEDERTGVKDDNTCANNANEPPVDNQNISTVVQTPDTDLSNGHDSRNMDENLNEVIVTLENIVKVVDNAESNEIKDFVNEKNNFNL